VQVQVRRLVWSMMVGVRVSEQQVHSKVSLRRAVDAVQRCGVVCVRTGRQRWESGATRKQPANLGVEGSEESLSILSDYTPTVRPPPKRC
jgi:hypothetical protein